MLYCYTVLVIPYKPCHCFCLIHMLTEKLAKLFACCFCCSFSASGLESSKPQWPVEVAKIWTLSSAPSCGTTPHPIEKLKRQYTAVLASAGPTEWSHFVINNTESLMHWDICNVQNTEWALQTSASIHPFTHTGCRGCHAHQDLLILTVTHQWRTSSSGPFSMQTVQNCTTDLLIRSTTALLPESLPPTVMSYKFQITRKKVGVFA